VVNILLKNTLPARAIFRNGAPMRILITGVCGFAGSTLARELAARGHTVSGCDNFIRPGSETNRELAARLHLSERTVCRRLEGVYAKLHLPDRLQAAVYAVVHRLVTPGEEASNLREVM